MSRSGNGGERRYDTRSDVMSTFTVTADCTACGACLATCPTRAFRVVRGRPPLVVIAERCTGCAACAEVCPVEACVVPGTAP